MRATVGNVLRQWYSIGETHHRQLALAAMLATGSDDFMDILVPLLTDKDREVRISAYEAGEAFYPTSLGADWRRVVDGWDEAARADFVSDLTHRSLKADIGESFATSDPSAKVREQAIQELSWIGATDALVRVVQALDDTGLEVVLPALVPETIPCAVRSLCFVSVYSCRQAPSSISLHQSIRPHSSPASVSEGCLHGHRGASHD
jgi:hypothetical protein